MKTLPSAVECQPLLKGCFNCGEEGHMYCNSYPLQERKYILRNSFKCGEEGHMYVTSWGKKGSYRPGCFTIRQRKSNSELLQEADMFSRKNMLSNCSKGVDGKTDFEKI